ncbi:MAG: KH domain-containing protein [Verrucomicrobiota bacterium]|nr:KH domain-containing protein [Verrucomicrobiota bacterium]
MVKGLFKKLLGKDVQEDLAVGQEDLAVGQEDLAVGQEDLAVGQEDLAVGEVVADANLGSEGAELASFVNFVVSRLVDSPKKVNVEVAEKGKNISLNITCEKSDIGKVIGKRGRTISAIRSLINGAGSRLGKKTSVEVLD